MQVVLPARLSLVVAAAATATVASCATARVQAREWHPVPDVSPESVSIIRGTAAAAGALSNEDQADIVTAVLRSFYFPTENQARWLDPRPLAHLRVPAADDTVGADVDFADEVMANFHSHRICIFGGLDRDCKGKPGGVVRFSWPYRIGKDSAIVFATYSPRDSSGKVNPVQSEMQFRMKRNNDEDWEMDGKGAVSVNGTPNTRKP
ncbi:MAG TPA: hypothetical protein VF483_01550 [Gemmatimonadaceae bacterium]